MEIHTIDIEKRIEVNSPVPIRQKDHNIRGNILIDANEYYEDILQHADNQLWFQDVLEPKIASNFIDCDFVLGTGVLEDIASLAINKERIALKVIGITSKHGKIIKMITCETWNCEDPRLEPELSSALYSGFLGRELVAGRSKNLKCLMLDNLSLPSNEVPNSFGMRYPRVGVMSNLVCVTPNGDWRKEEDRIAVKCTTTLKPHKLVQFYIHCKANRCGRLLTIVRHFKGDILEVSETKMELFEQRHKNVLRDVWKDSLKWIFFTLKQIQDTPLPENKPGFQIIFRAVNLFELRSLNPAHRMTIEELEEVRKMTEKEIEEDNEVEEMISGIKRLQVQNESKSKTDDKPEKTKLFFDFTGREAADLYKK
eukprot:GHVL01010139.1.p1 GENE.GHVL01010139.1~~GHVL01010139.1.p1  ORF type:complete len:390 (-),score=95.45 GHVL01010139.1:18-1121(-)